MSEPTEQFDGPPHPDAIDLAAQRVRPHEEQTPLERVLRSHLWHPNDIIARGKVELPKCVKAKQYQEAADWQKLISKAQHDAKEWTYLLELYEQERRQNDRAKCPQCGAAGHFQNLETANDALCDGGGEKR